MASRPAVKISVYTNCSLGGMVTVLRNRAAAEPDTRHLMYFVKDAGGRKSLEKLPNVDLRIMDIGRLRSAVRHACNTLNPDEISVTSIPVLVDDLVDTAGSSLVYEFHTSDTKVIGAEIMKMDRLPGRIRVPSEYSAGLVRAALPHGAESTVEVVANQIDREVFRSRTPTREVRLAPEAIPLVWVGRFDKGKNPNDFARLLSLLPDSHRGVMVVSLEDDPDRLERFLGVATGLRVDSRIDFHANLAPDELADLYVAAAAAGGAYVSTSLAESFGFAVVEASACGLPCIAYDVGPLSEHEAPGVRTVPAGDLYGMRDAVLDTVGQQLLEGKRRWTT